MDKNMEKLKDFIKESEDLSETIRVIHNHVCHFSSEDINEDIRANLYRLNQLYEHIREIEELSTKQI